MTETIGAILAAVVALATTIGGPIVISRMGTRREARLRHSIDANLNLARHIDEPGSDSRGLRDLVERQTDMLIGLESKHRGHWWRDRLLRAYGPGTFLLLAAATGIVAIAVIWRGDQWEAVSALLALFGCCYGAGVMHIFFYKFPEQFGLARDNT